ncbi:MAG TPA: hypothetical protein PLQ00_12840 [Thermoguttaceae bacterium]|nr:hypothetical protein [Thermoguttaceae bacterium]
MKSANLWMIATLAAGGVWLAQVDWSAYSQESPAPKDEVLDLLDARARSFLESVSQGAAQQAFETLLRGSPLLLQKTDALKTLVERAGQIPNRFGRFRGFERIDARRAGKDLVFLRYLYKCEDFPIVWSITFYRPISRSDAPPDDAAWRVIVVRFDTEVEQLVRS